MSFSVDLWNSFEFVENNFLLHHRGLKDFIFMMTERHNSEMANASVLKKIHELNFAVTTFDSLFDGIIGFKGDMLNQYNYTVEFCNGIKDEILIPLTTLYEQLQTKITRISNTMKNIDKTYSSAISRLEANKIKFHSSARAAEEHKLRCEASKRSDKVNAELKAKFEMKAMEALKLAKETENAYVNSLNLANATQEVYIEVKKKCLNDIQDLEEELGESIKDSLRKYVIFQVAYLRNMQYDIEKKAKLMESINIRKDVRNFINKNATNALPPYKFEFMPFVSDFDANSNSYANSDINLNIIPKEIVSNVKTFISNVFFSDSPTETNITEIKTQNEIDNIVSAVYQGKAIPTQLHNVISQYIRNKKTRKIMLQYLNQVRVKGVFTLDEVSYNTIGDILIECLNVLQLERDFESVKMIINLSITLYKTNLQANKPRIFLYSYIETHTIWRSENFWKELIKYNIIEEMHNQKSYNIYNNESVDEKNVRIRKIAENQCVSTLYNMISFGVDSNIMKKCVGYFEEYYEMSKEEVDSMMKMINEYEKKKIEQDKEKEKETQPPSDKSTIDKSTNS